ncbi:hypothetical protein LX32DRAFT_94173 [Colletotrichum zoysiae]|uniref:Uncharacterized protein n=1 Tax=Colletotrichum zoysiae TaxID=1216348 RepID=A0AAD9M061_9PEZI|nr:hypothetical protein LX32DRAFT_94173 [Colletotrichum zoysiae]
MTAYVTWGFNLPSNPPPPAAKEEKPKTPPPPAKSPKQPTHITFFHLPGWLYRPAKIVVFLALAGLCIAGAVFVTDLLDAKIGHGGFLPHPPVRADGAGAGHGFGVYDSAGNGQHGAVKPEEWCQNHPGDCHWTDSQGSGSGSEYIL